MEVKCFSNICTAAPPACVYPPLLLSLGPAAAATRMKGKGIADIGSSTNSLVERTGLESLLSACRATISLSQWFMYIANPFEDEDPTEEMRVNR